MTIDVNCFDVIEVNYLDERKEPRVEFFSGSLELAKEFVRNAIERHVEVQTVTYFIELMIRGSGERIARQPSKRFAEHQFSPTEFLILPADWVEETRTTTNSEIDAYMAENYGATYKN